MNWEETLITKIDWGKPKLKVVEDDSMELHINISLMALLENQARISFLKAILATLSFVTTAQEQNRAITPEDMEKFFDDCGLPELKRVVVERKEAL